MQERLWQTIVILKKLRDDLALPYDAPEIQAIKEQMAVFVRDGMAWKGAMSLEPWGREAVLEMKNDKIELTLRTLRKGR